MRYEDAAYCSRPSYVTCKQNFQEIVGEGKNLVGTRRREVKLPCRRSYVTLFCANRNFPAALTRRAYYKRCGLQLRLTMAVYRSSNEGQAA